MALSVNLGQINAAAKDNQPLRETLTAVHNEFQSIYSQIGAGPIQKVDSTGSKFAGPPPASQLSVTGANGQFSVSITLPQQAGGAGAPKNATNAPIYQELSSSPAADFTSGVVTYPISTGTSFVFPNPGTTLYWRLRSSYDQKTFNSYTYSGAVSAGLQSSAASDNNLSLNQSNFATADSVAGIASATVRVYGSGGVGTAWPTVRGTRSTLIPSGTILNVSYGSNSYIAWDGTQYQLKPSLTQTFPDHWIPVGQVSVIANGAGLVLPTFRAVVADGSLVAIQILSAGNGLTAIPTLTITDPSGSGATAVCTIGGGTVTGVTITNAGNGYSSSPTITASGGVASGTGGGGGALGNNGGRLYGQTT